MVDFDKIVDFVNNVYGSNEGLARMTLLEMGIDPVTCRPTKRAPDAGDSATPQTLSPQSGESTPEVVPSERLEIARRALLQYASGKTWRHIAMDALAEIDAIITDPLYT